MMWKDTENLIEDAYYTYEKARDYHKVSDSMGSASDAHEFALKVVEIEAYYMKRGNQ